MSANPPPPPFISVPSSGAEQRWQPKARRDQRLAAKQRRATYAAQLRLTRRKSLLGPVFLVTLGSVFLFAETGVLRRSTTLEWVGQWWPLILVASGVVLLIEWALDLWMADGRSVPLPRRTVGGGTVLLLLLLCISGVAANGVIGVPGWFPRPGNVSALDFWGINSRLAPRNETVHTLSKPIRPAGLLQIRNPRGSITITGASQDGQVHISAHQRLWTWRNFALHRREERDHPRLESSAAGLVLSVGGDGRDQTDLTIDVPHETSLEINAGAGQLTVSELRTTLTIQDHKGDITLTALTGHLTVNARDDNATIAGHSLSGDLTITGRTGDLAFSDISGPLSLHGDFFGATHLERVRGLVQFQSSYTTFQCAGVPGELSVEGRTELQGHNIAGPVTLVTSDRDVTLEDVQGSAALTDRDGKVDLSLAAPLGPVTVSTSNGFLHLRVPNRSGFRVSASTTNGEIKSDLDLRPDQKEDRTTLMGDVRKGGPLLQLQNANGEISVSSNPPPSQTRHSDDEGRF